MKVSITKAANLASVSRTTLYNDMNSGKVTFETSGKNKKTIDVSELERVYGSLNVNQSKEVSSSQKGEQKFTKITPKNEDSLVELAVLREKMEIIEEERKRERDQLTERIDHLQENLNKAQDNQNKTTLLLENYTKEETGNDWKESIKALEDKIANQEKETREKAEEETKQKELLLAKVSEHELEKKDLSSANKIYAGLALLAVFSAITLAVIQTGIIEISF